ncbi:MAG: hypothetical protein Q4E18_05035 [Clostridia bacterium]|nr:hypothetical protein [Clostridia bacterium]
MHSRFAVARRLLIFWTLFIGLGAVGGAVCMLIDPSGRSVGMDGMLPYFQVLPFADVLFQNLLFSGFALLIVNGLSNLTAAALLFARRKIGAVLGGIFGVTLMLWICIQFYMFPPNFMSTIYFFFGLAQAATGWAAVVFQRQEAFAAEAHEYPNLETNHARLVVYFSRMGYVREKALEEANRTGADVYEIRSTERTEGTIGFWWCGRYGMHRWEMPIETPNINLPSYEHVTICAPIWVFALAAPVRTFCRSAKGRIREVDYILVHHTHGLYTNAADEMDALLGLRRTHLTSIRCVTGAYRETRTETK